MARHTALALFAPILLTAAAIAGPCDTVRIAPPDVVPPTDFGSRVEVDGNFWFISDINARVGCPGTFGCTTGAVHVYEMVDGQLEFRQMITPPVPRVGDFFGSAVDAQDGRLMIGSRLHDWPGLEARGGAFIYEYDGAQWTMTGDIRPPAGVDPRLADELGGFVAIEGDAAYLKAVDEETVFVYELEGGAWMFDQVIESPDGLPSTAGFGSRVVPGGPWLFIGASRDSTAFDRGGSVYVFRREPDGSIVFHQKLMPTDVPGGVAENQFFGIDVSYDGQTLAIGAYGAHRGGLSTGAVLIYALVGDTWTLTQELLPPPSTEPDAMGLPTLVRGDVLLSKATLATPTTSATLQYFRRDAGGVWHHAAELIPDVPYFAGNFARIVAIQGDLAMVSASDDMHASGDEYGAAYLFDLSCYDCAPDLDADGSLPSSTSSPTSTSSRTATPKPTSMATAS